MTFQIVQHFVRRPVQRHTLIIGLVRDAMKRILAREKICRQQEYLRSTADRDFPAESSADDMAVDTLDAILQERIVFPMSLSVRQDAKRRVQGIAQAIFCRHVNATIANLRLHDLVIRLTDGGKVIHDFQQRRNIEHLLEDFHFLVHAEGYARRMRRERSHLVAQHTIRIRHTDDLIRLAVKQQELILDGLFNEPRIMILLEYDIQQDMKRALSDRGIVLKSEVPLHDVVMPAPWLFDARNEREYLASFLNEIVDVFLRLYPELFNETHQ